LIGLFYAIASRGRQHMGANGVSWPPGKMDEKLKSENMQKEQFWGAIGADRCRERRYADHTFIPIYFTMHRFVVKFKKNRLRRQGGD